MALRTRRTRAKDVICRCQSYCTIFNPATGRYQGEGQVQSRSTRDRHSRDDRMRNNTQPLQPQPMANVARSWLDVVSDELDGLSLLPDTGTRPLIFRNSPSDNGDFTWPTINEMLQPNNGLHALSGSRVNRGFLWVEHRLCVLHSLARNSDNQHDPLDLDSLMTRLEAELARLTREKDVEWAHQRSQSGIGLPFVSTGKGYLSMC
jgi:hypothetical protein